MTGTNNSTVTAASHDAHEKQASELRTLIQESFQARERVSAILASWKPPQLPLPPKEVFKNNIAKMNDEIDELRQKLKGLEDGAESVHQIARDDCLERLETLLKEMRSVYKEFGNKRDDANSTYTSHLNRILRDSRAKIAAIQAAMPLQTSQPTTGYVPPLQQSASSGSYKTFTTKVSRSFETQSSAVDQGSSFDSHIEIQDSSIHFRKLYNNNKLIFASEIIDCPKGSNSFYILLCKDHRIFFQKTPLLASRVHAVQHGERRNCSREALVELFGIRVVECTAKEVKEYNYFTKVHLGSKSCGLEKRLKKVSSRQFSSDSRNNNRKHIVRPEVGGIYSVHLPILRTSFAAIILPYGHFGCIGLPHDIVESGLLYDSRRESHDYDVCTGNYTWKEGYENNGACEMFREYPVMLFNTDNFPNGCSFSWARAEQIRELDLLSDLTIPHRETVLDFVRHRDASGYNAETVAQGAPADCDRYMVHLIGIDKYVIRTWNAGFSCSKRPARAVASSRQIFS
ncbi:hypothetical protein E4U55_002311 [Claviceps digitariae]|nr:hypothetical protein E4U55_002311 [Claviceps digitariae]